MHVSTDLDVDRVAVEAAEQVKMLRALQAPELPGQGTRAVQTQVGVLDRAGSMDGEPRDAISALHDCDAEYGLSLMAGAMDQLFAPRSAIGQQGYIERSVKVSYASHGNRSRSRRPSRSHDIV